MVYSISLSLLAILMGVAYIASHAWAMIQHEKAREVARAFPRSPVMATMLITIAGIWTLWLAGTLDLMEYTHLRGVFFTVTALTFALVGAYLREFLAVRALGLLMLLFAQVMLDACFLRDDLPRLVITLNAYIYIIIGMWYIGAPYILRDWIECAEASTLRWQILCGSGVAYGVLLLALGIFVY